MSSQNNIKSKPLPSINALRSFEATARLGSVTSAASELCVTPSAVSHQIHKLEDYLDRSLIGFTNGKLQLSDWGATLLPGLTDAFMRIRESVDLMERHEKYSSLTVVLRPFFASHWLSRRLLSFWESHPDISLRMRYMLEQMESGYGNADVSIEWHRFRQEDVNYVELFPSFLTPICCPSLVAPNGPISLPGDLANQTLYHEADNDLWREWLTLAGVPNLVPRQNVFLDDGTIRLQAAIEGHGIELSVSGFLTHELENKLLIAPFEHLQLEGYYFLVHHTKPISTNARAFQNWLLDQIGRANNGSTYAHSGLSI